MIEVEEDEGPPGSPAWMATFADLMSLLMCFFVLLLSFSEMDVAKYKQVAGSMKNAFGVQNKVKVMAIPRGTSVIAREFSPGVTKPTQTKNVNQFTTETTKPSLRVGNPTELRENLKNLSDDEARSYIKELLEALAHKTRADADRLRKILGKEIEEGKIDIESHDRLITVRIRETGSFPSASATLNVGFLPVLEIFRNAMQEIDGMISIEGHTDNIPIYSSRFKSNWDLSSSRALSVAHELFKNDVLREDRFVVVGHADTRPFMPNDSSQNRAQNRRVEIIIRQGLDKVTAASVEELRRSNPRAVEALKADEEDGIDAIIESIERSPDAVQPLQSDEEERPGDL